MLSHPLPTYRVQSHIRSLMNQGIERPSLGSPEAPQAPRGLAPLEGPAGPPLPCRLCGQETLNQKNVWVI